MKSQPIFKGKAAPTLTWIDKELNIVTHALLRSMMNI
jgi:hypothetical protein